MQENGKWKQKTGAVRTWTRSGGRRLGRPSDEVDASYDYGCTHAPMLHWRPHAAHFRVQALANVDAKLRKTTYVIDPAIVPVTCGLQVQVQVQLSSPESAVRFRCGGCVLLHRVRSSFALRQAPITIFVVELTSELVAGAVPCNSRAERAAEGAEGRVGAARCKRTAAGCVVCRRLNKQHRRCKGVSRFSGAKLSWMAARNEQPHRAPACRRHSERP